MSLKICNIEKLYGPNFPGWKKNVELILGEKNLDDVLRTNPPTDPKEKEAFMLRSSSTKYQIAQGVEDFLVSAVIECKTAKEAWDMLEKKYNNPNCPIRKQTAQKNWANLTLMEGESPQRFVSRVKNLQKEMNDMKMPVNDDSAIMHLLRNLPPRFEKLVDHYRFASDRTYEDLEQKMHSLTMSEVADAEAPPVIAAAYGMKAGASAGTNKFKKAKAKPPAQPRLCFNCGNPGHFKAACPFAEAAPTSKTPPAGVTKKAYTTTVCKESKVLTASVGVNEEVPAMDSGSEAHVFHTESVFVNRRPCDPEWIVDGGGERHLVKEIGDVEIPCITPRKKKLIAVFTGVKLVPTLTMNLLSVRLLEKKGLQLLFKDGKVMVGDADSTEIDFTASVRPGSDLYWLDICPDFQRKHFSGHSYKAAAATVVSTPVLASIPKPVLTPDAVKEMKVIGMEAWLEKYYAEETKRLQAAAAVVPAVDRPAAAASAQRSITKKNKFAERSRMPAAASTVLPAAVAVSYTHLTLPTKA